MLTKMPKLKHETFLSVTEKPKSITRFVVVIEVLKDAFLENKQKPKTNPYHIAKTYR